MSLLAFLEEKLGPTAAWPTHVLRLLFDEAGTTLTMTAVSAFFYGNSIPLNAALSYRICNDNLHDVVDIALEDCYDTWDATSYAPWPLIYYDMSRKKHRFINEPVLRVSEETFGFVGNGDVCLTDEVQRELNRAKNTSYSSQ
jgi:hypothetical protein